MQPIAKRCKALGISPAVMGYAKKTTNRNPGSQMRKKKSEYSLQLAEKQKVKFIYGIGRKSAQEILAQTGVNPDTRVKDLTDADEAKLREAIDHSYIVEGDLRRQTALDIKRLSEIGCYRGTRHRRGLPVRGQRSKTNARTRKGPKKTIANKKK